MDEQHGVVVFTKLDMRAGYHQIQVVSEDRMKTSFRIHLGHFEFTVLPFGLSNASATFQSTMNQVFQPLLQKYVIVFFDDILIYSKSWETHIDHLEVVFELLRRHSFFIRESKCSFELEELAYLGFIISTTGISPDSDKIHAVTNWPTPKTAKQFRAFLGLTGYYRRFVGQYALIAVPLTNLLRKEGFVWSDEAQEAFEQLKIALTSALVLVFPNFNIPFIVEMDVCGVGIGAILLQLKHPIAYFSKKLSLQHQQASTYSKELWALIEAIHKWRHYLLGSEFVIRTDHSSLKNLLN